MTGPGAVSANAITFARAFLGSSLRRLRRGGATPALAAVINAIVDALAELGVRHIEMPATPERVWRAIQAARSAAAGVALAVALLASLGAFVRGSTASMTERAIAATRDGRVRLVPERWTSFYMSWLETVQVAQHATDAVPVPLEGVLGWWTALEIV